MSQVIVELATRHGINSDGLQELLEAWAERAAIHEYLAGFDRRVAEVWAVSDVEQMYSIGLQCPETRQQMLSGGRRSRPSPRGSAAPARQPPECLEVK